MFGIWGSKMQGLDALRRLPASLYNKLLKKRRRAGARAQPDRPVVISNPLVTKQPVSWSFADVPLDSFGFGKQAKPYAVFLWMLGEKRVRLGHSDTGWDV